MFTKKNLLVILATMLMVFCTFSISASASDDVSVMLNGDILEFDVQPQIINGRTLVPMRKIFESLGATVEWEDSTQTITAKRNETTIVMQIDNNVMSVNGNPVTLDVPPQLVDSRTLVPVRAVAESFDAQVVWEEYTNSVLISTITNSVHFHSYNDEFTCEICGNIDKTDMCALLKYWIYKFGEVKGEYASVFVPVENNLYSSFTINYNISNDSLYISYFTENGTLNDSTDNYMCMIYLTSNSQEYRYTAAYGNPPIGCDGIINASTYTKNSPLPCIKYYGNSNDRIEFIEYTRGIINAMLGSFDTLLYDCLAESSISDFGFIKFDTN